MARATLASFALAAIALVGCRRAQPLRVAAAGDVQLGAALAASPFADGALLAGDVRLVNLEGPLTARGAAADDKFAFDPARAAWLRDRVDVVSLANNHALDQGLAGRADTVRALDGAGVAAAFDGHDAVVARRGREVTVIARAFAPDADLDGADAAALVAAVARAARPTIVSLHWGHTGSLLPTDEQKRLAHRLVDAGAVAVLGHGPHTPQGTEWYQSGTNRYRRGVIAYSLGNFAFGCACTEVADAYVVGFTIDGDGGARDVVVTPIVAGLLRPPARAHDPGLHAQLADLCRDLSSGVTVE